MKKLFIEMPTVSRCLATECAYNVKEDCHARAITVGNSLHAGCDTFFPGADHTNAVHRTAGVGACKSQACQFNEDFECMADHVTVAHKGREVNCMTYTPH